MVEKETPLPLGCWRYLIALPVLVLFQRLYEPWDAFIRPLLPSNLSDQAQLELCAFPFLFLMTASLWAVYWLLDWAFGTRLGRGGFFSRDAAMPAGKRAALRRRGVVIVLAVVAIDQAAKGLFGDDVPYRSHSPQDAAIIASGLAYLMFAVVWWLSRTRLTSLAASLMLSSGISFAIDLALRKGPFGIPVHALGFSFVFTPAEIAVVSGLALYALSWFWDPGDAPPELEH